MSMGGIFQELKLMQLVCQFFAYSVIEGASQWGQFSTR